MSAPLQPASAPEGAAAATSAPAVARADARPGDGSGPEAWSAKSQAHLFGLQLSLVVALMIVAVFIVVAAALAVGMSDGSSQRAEIQQQFNERYDD